MLGTGKALVTAVGKNSQAGDIQMLLGGLKRYLLVLIRDFTGGEGQGRSVLQTKLFKLTVWIGVAGVVFALLTTIVLITQYVLEVPGEEVKAKDIVNYLDDRNHHLGRRRTRGSTLGCHHLLGL